MRVLITGGKSSIATALIPKIKSYGEVLTAGRNDCDISLDFNNAIPLNIPNGIDCLIHTAAAFGGKTYEEISETESVNVSGTLAVCECARKAGVSHFIYISSIFAELPSHSPFYSVYSISKRHSEELLMHYCALTQFPLTIVRPSQLYGDSDSFRKHQPFIYAIADKAQNNEDIMINGNNDPKRNFLHVDDLAETLLRIVQNRITGKFQCAYPEDYTFTRISQAAINAFDSLSTIQFRKDQQDIPDNIFVPDTSIYKITGYSPLIPIEEGMKRIAQHRSERR